MKRNDWVIASLKAIGIDADISRTTLRKVLAKRVESIEASTEKKITAIAAKFGLTVHFDGDPRGYVVKLHAPKGDVYNTWGGKETGYGVG